MFSAKRGNLKRLWKEVQKYYKDGLDLNQIWEKVSSEYETIGKSKSYLKNCMNRERGMSTRVPRVDMDIPPILNTNALLVRPPPLPVPGIQNFMNLTPQNDGSKKRKRRHDYENLEMFGNRGRRIVYAKLTLDDEQRIVFLFPMILGTVYSANLTQSGGKKYLVVYLDYEPFVAIVKGELCQQDEKLGIMNSYDYDTKEESGAIETEIPRGKEEYQIEIPENTCMSTGFVWYPSFDKYIYKGSIKLIPFHHQKRKKLDHVNPLEMMKRRLSGEKKEDEDEDEDENKEEQSAKEG